ncbi:MAG: hypothetical protein AB4372_08865 [Xenococcus sp. (in: cyanobacteria)]
MIYHIAQLPNQRWGIYLQLKLLATVGCYDTARKILELLGRKNQALRLTS